jgi:cellulose synthase/poly-beta-1,6-N-acetylglucosamine synthase-like glycosyltransferase
MIFLGAPMNIVSVFIVLASVASVICMIYTFYFGFIALFSFRKPFKRSPANRFNRIRILIAARNEDFVIGHLIDSLRQQNYPQDKFDIFVIPNNCTDRTREVALGHGAQVFDCVRPIRSKGDALEEAIDSMIADESIEAYCIFDADNLVHPEFLAEMNKALEAGEQAAQGYRDSKNPVDSAIATSYSIYYWMIDRFYNRPRQAIGFSAMIGGSGFIISRNMLVKLGGWKTQTITEDLEITIDCVLAGEKVSYVQEAVFYDEQPLNFKQSWHQRLRWSTGIWQCLKKYSAKLAKYIIRKKDRNALDLLLLLLNPVIQLVYFVSFALFIIIQVSYLHIDLFLSRRFYFLIFQSADFSYFVTTFLAFLTVIFEKKRQPQIYKGIAYYWIFLMSWMVIQLVSLFKPATRWKATVHNRAVSLK